MTDALRALEQISTRVAKLTELVARTRSESISPSAVRAKVHSLAATYFEYVRPELDDVKRRAGLVEEIDFVIGALLGLTTAARERAAYTGQLNELRPYLAEATIDVMMARGVARLVLSQTERGIMNTLERMLPASATSYEQVLRDMAERKRLSWRGTGTELREVLREVLDHLAPDDKVKAAPGFQLEADRLVPTQRQKTRFIMKARRRSAAIGVAEAALESFEAGIATLVRSTYTRGSVSTHSSTGAEEIRKLKGYVDALLVELLAVSV